MRLLRTTLILLAALLTCACNNFTPISGFLEDSTLRLEVDGAKVFTFDENNCQTSFNKSRGEFCVMTDTALDWFSITVEEVPQHSGEKTEATVIWNTDGTERSRNNITLEAVAIKGDLIWLCDEGRHVAAVVRVLE